MIKQIIRDTFFLQQKSTPATQEDVHIMKDMIDTLQANHDACVGMAANMIGYLKDIIVFYDGKMICVMVNPKIINQKGIYTCEEGCLSLDGKRMTERYHEITVNYLDMNFHKHTKKYKGYTAEIIQHEMDHLEGKII